MFNAAVFRDTGGAVVGILAAARDITQQKQIEQGMREQQTYTRSLIESNIDALITTDTLGIITDVNRQMCAVTGRSPEDLIGTPFKDYFTDSQPRGGRYSQGAGRGPRYRLRTHDPPRIAERTWFPTTLRPSREPTDIYAGSSRPHATSPRKNSSRSRSGSKIAS